MTCQLPNDKRTVPVGIHKPHIFGFRPWPECDHLLYQAQMGDQCDAGGSARDAGLRLLYQRLMPDYERWPDDVFGFHNERGELVDP